MPTQEINKAITMLEFQVQHYEKMLDQSISSDEVFSKAKNILRKLKEVSRELDELKRIQAGNN